MSKFRFVLALAVISTASAMILVFALDLPGFSKANVSEEMAIFDQEEQKDKNNVNEPEIENNSTSIEPVASENRANDPKADDVKVNDGKSVEAGGEVKMNDEEVSQKDESSSISDIDTDSDSDAEQNLQSALDQFNPANAVVEYGNNPAEIQYAMLEGYENVADTLNSYYLDDENTKIQEINDNVFVTDQKKDSQDKDAEENDSKTKNSKNFNVKSIVNNSFVNSVDVLTLKFSAKPDVSELKRTDFSLVTQKKENINPVAILIKNREVVLSFDVKDSPNFSVLKINDIKSETSAVMEGGYLPILQNTDQLDYDLMVSNLYGSYVVDIVDQGIVMEDNISFGAMDDIRTSSTIGISFNNKANVPESCGIFVYGTNLMNLNKKEDVFYLKNYTLFSRQNKFVPIKETLFKVFEKYLSKHEMVIGTMKISDLDEVKGLPTLYVNLRKPKEVNSSNLYRGKLSFDLFCS